jgi:hypothetical protein
MHPQGGLKDVYIGAKKYLRSIVYNTLTTKYRKAVLRSEEENFSI